MLILFGSSFSDPGRTNRLSSDWQQRWFKPSASGSFPFFSEEVFSFIIMGDVEKSLSDLSLGLGEDEELLLQDDDLAPSRSDFQAKTTLLLDTSLNAGDPITMTHVRNKAVNQMFFGNSVSCQLGPMTGHAILGQVDVTSANAMETGDAEEVPLEHSEGLKRQRLHLLSSFVSSSHVDSGEDSSTIEAGLAIQARRH
ncbi:hypothetical protein V6N13_040994 [Hibiscus sabdariffa]|uniref:Uncharacterized protein n=1 Tax=Hibiscus sabdariffa TaxID=183260 RepID=A0ABR2RAE3_9ROSI